MTELIVSFDLVAIISSLSLIAAIIAAYYAKRTYWSGKTPKLMIEYVHPSLCLRNVGTDIAKEIKSNTQFGNLKNELWNFIGPINYIQTENSSYVANLIFAKDPKPDETRTVRFDYKNAEGSEFYSFFELYHPKEAAKNYYLIKLTHHGKT